MNKKKRVLFTTLLLLVSVFIMTACKKDASTDESADETISEYPEIAYIDNVSYYKTDEICETVPRKMPDGVIETFVSPEIMPDSFNSANFGSEYESMEYMFLEDGQLIVHVGENWYKMTTENE